MIRALLDPQIFINQKVGGVSRQFVEVWQRLAKRKDIIIRAPLYFTENYHLLESSVKLGSPFNLLRNKNFQGKDKIIEILNHASLYQTKAFLRRKRYDVFLTTYYEHYFINQLGQTPLIVSVYDMIHEQFPEYFPNDFTTIQYKKVLLYRADRLVVHSHQTKNDIFKFYPDINPEKIDLFPLASCIKNQDSQIISHRPSTPYLLYVGTRDKYKNFLFFLEAIQGLLRQGTLHLVCAGGGNFTESELELISNYGLGGAVFQRVFKDEELPALYKGAEALVFPSRYEGFGMPILEAMKCGCPVVLSNIDVFKEVAGEAALYFSLDSHASLYNVVKRLLDDATLRGIMVELGKERERQYSWDKTALGYLNSIRKALAIDVNADEN